jgi:hypothetical protein
MDPMDRLSAWLRRRDPGLAATRRAARTAVGMPGLFAVCTQVLHAPVMGTFAELTWLAAVLAAVLAAAGPDAEDGPTATPQSTRLRKAAAAVLDRSAEMLESPGISPDALRADVRELREALGALEETAVDHLPMRVPSADGQAALDVLVDSLDISFRSQEVAFVVLQVAENLDRARAARGRSWPEQLLGREPGSAAGPLSSARERAAAHLEPHSVWLLNSIRGATGLGIGVALANAASVQHAFWVMLGTLSVLRSNALNT